MNAAIALNDDRLFYHDAFSLKWDSHLQNVPNLLISILGGFVDKNIAIATVRIQEVLSSGFAGIGATTAFDQIHVHVTYVPSVLARGAKSKRKTVCFKINANTNTLLN